MTRSPGFPHTMPSPLKALNPGKRLSKEWLVAVTKPFDIAECSFPLLARSSVYLSCVLEAGSHVAQAGLDLTMQFKDVL